MNGADTTTSGALPGRGRERIEHVIVLMMENRSFDHLLGYVDHDDPTYPSLRTQGFTCPRDPERPGHDLVSTTPDARPVLGVDPDHSHEAVLLQMYGHQGVPQRDAPRMNGFIRSYALKIGRRTPRRTGLPGRVLDALAGALARWVSLLRRRPAPVRPHPEDIMRCFPDSGIPVLSRLVREYAVLVNWHCSVPGETWPNRNFAHAATSDGTADIDVRFYDNTTIFERLSLAGRRWHVYHDGLAQVWAFPRLWLQGTDAFHDAEELLDHIREDSLPAYSFVEPDHGFGRGQGNSQHPGNNTTARGSFVAGEALMAGIHNALVASPEVFAKTLLLITYDEHGGFFDHVPPLRVVSPDGKVSAGGFDFTVTGPRVPAVAISPLVPRGTVEHHVFEHASIPRTVREQFAPDQAPLTARDREAQDLLAVLPLLPAARTDCRPIPVPEVPGRPGRGAARTRGLDEFEASLLELGGAVRTRIRRPEVARMAPDGVVPVFRPDPAMAAAARARVMNGASEASRAVTEVVAHFAR